MVLCNFGGCSWMSTETVFCWISSLSHLFCKNFKEYYSKKGNLNLRHLKLFFNQNFVTIIGIYCGFGFAVLAVMFCLCFYLLHHFYVACFVILFYSSQFGLKNLLMINNVITLYFYFVKNFLLSYFGWCMWSW